ncbi:MAG: mdcB [Herminiimonas sp.]|nr:mdcB [Herminiimonas sp.]
MKTALMYAGELEIGAGRAFAPDWSDAVRRNRAFCIGIGRLAVQSLHAELALYPKPGLVSPVDNGSHDDMTATTFMRSLFSLRHYFIRIAEAGMENATFTTLKRLGVAAEQRMLAATGGVNTHRGAIFCLGLLCAAIGSCRARHIPLSASAIRTVLLDRWGEALSAHMQSPAADSHGLQVAAMHAASGAREEAALGLPSVFEVALPMLQQVVAAGRCWNDARVDALFSLMAHISDTNVYHRGGAAAAAMVRDRARRFLALGGTAHPGWKAAALDCHRAFVASKISPGGAADLLAATCLVYQAMRRFQ